MSWPLPLAAAFATVLVGGCARYHDVAYVSPSAPSVVVEPGIETDVFPAYDNTTVETHYRRRLGEQPPLPLGNRDGYTYYQRSVTLY